jgi:hypothetical protein
MHGQCTVTFQKTVVYGRVREKYDRLRSPYMVIETYDRDTGPCNTEKYGRIRSVDDMYTVVNDRIWTS